MLAGTRCKRVRFASADPQETANGRKTKVDDCLYHARSATPTTSDIGSSSTENGRRNSPAEENLMATAAQ